MADMIFWVGDSIVVPVNIEPLVDDTDQKTIEAVAYNAAGMALRWNFVTPLEGAMTSTAVTPTTGGVHDWTDLGGGMMKIEIPSAGGTVNNDTEGFGWFSGKATGVMPWRGPIIEFAITPVPTVEQIVDAILDEPMSGHNIPGTAGEALGLLEYGVVVADAGNTAQFFKTDLASSVGSYCIGSFLKFTSGTLINQVRRIAGYSGTSKFVTLSASFTGIPAANDGFVIVNQ